MTTSAGSRADFRARVRDLLRTSILDSARRLAIERDWDDVRIADIAGDVGVSRQTIYSEFGAKEALGMALFRREVEQHLALLVDAIQRAPDFPTAVRRTIEISLETARTHPVVARVLQPGKDGAGSALLPLLTSRADLFLVPLRGALAAALLERFPSAAPERAELITDLCIRATLSQAVLPSDLPQAQVIDTIVAMVVAVAREAAAAD